MCCVALVNWSCGAVGTHMTFIVASFSSFPGPHALHWAPQNFTGHPQWTSAAPYFTTCPLLSCPLSPSQHSLLGCVFNSHHHKLHESCVGSSHPTHAVGACRCRLSLFRYFISCPLKRFFSWLAWAFPRLCSGCFAFCHGLSYPVRHRKALYYIRGRSTQLLYSLQTRMSLKWIV